MTKLHALGVGTICIGLLLSTAACSDDDVTQECGNDLVEGTEQCDGDQLGSNTCTTLGGDFTGGTLACSSQCSYDTSGCTTGQPVCGDGAIDAGEDCDSTNLGGQGCADVGNYTGGTLACGADCTWDVSACDTALECGNDVIDTNEDCDNANLDGQTCADVGNYIGGTLACATDCTWDVSSCDVPTDCGNEVIDTGEDCDATNLGGQTCADVGNYTGGTLGCATDCTWDESACEYVLTPSEQINVVRAVPDATGYSLDVENVLVTYLKPALGNDPAGFVVQADPLGPALFVRLDPTSLMPNPAPGDEVSFIVVEVTTDQGRREVLTVSGWVVHSWANPLAPLVQTVNSATDLVSGLDDYEVELITLDGTMVADFVGAGSGHLQATIETDGIVGEANLRLRLPETLAASSGLAIGCIFTVTQTPLWRYTTTTQVMAYDAAEFTVQGCPAPRVVSANATGDATVVITMDRPMDGTSITNAAAQLTFTGGLTATAATVNLTEITVTTSTQTPSASYDVTVAGSVTDTLGVGVDPTADTATFLGYDTNAVEQNCDDGVDNNSDGYVDCQDTDCAGDAACNWGSQLYLWELDTDQVSTDATEYVEIWNNTGGTIDFDASSDKFFLLLINGSGEIVYGGVQLTGTLADGDIHVVGVAAVPNVDQILTPATNAIQNGVDGVLLVQCNTCTDRTTDFPSGWNPVYSATPPHYTSDDGKAVTRLDALAYETADSNDVALQNALDVSAQHDEHGGPNGLLDSLQRTSLQGWIAAPPTPGLTGIE